MKKVFTVLVLLSAMMLVMAQVGPDFNSISKNIVKNSLEVQPGDVVLLYGTPAELKLLGAMYVAVAKAGGQPYISVTIPEAQKQALMETPMEYLGQVSLLDMMQMKMANCVFYSGSDQDPGLFAEVPEERMAAARKGSGAFNEATRTAKFRGVSLGQTGGIPSPAFAKSQNADYQEMVDMFWNSIDADYGRMTSSGKQMSKLFKTGSQVRITSESGTDLQLKIDHYPARINCGRCLENENVYGPDMAYLPAGEVYTCVEPTSAKGKVVVPKTTFRGQEVKNLTLTFENGRITRITADQNGELIKKTLEMGTGDKDVLSIVDVGINPESHPLKGSDYYSWEMAGMITISTGINQWAGGEVVSDVGLSLHLANSSLVVDGVELVKDGKLVSPQALAGNQE
jgi:aminopeptidase